MKRFSKLRELVARARDLEAEGARLRSPEARLARFLGAAEARARAKLLAGRITRHEYYGRLCEIQDARNAW